MDSDNFYDEQHHVFRLSRFTSIYIDKEGALNLEDAKTKFHNGFFSTQEEDDVTGGYHASDVLWIHVPIDWNTVPDDILWLHILPDIIDEITLFSEEGCGQNNRISGRKIPLLSREKPIWGYAFRMEHHLKKSCEYYIKIKSLSALRIEINLWKEADLEVFTSRISAIFSAYIGMMLLMFSISSIRAIFYKTRGDSAYSLHILGFEMLNMGGIGMIQTMGLSDNFELRMSLVQLGGTIASSAFAILTLQLIDWPAYDKKILAHTLKPASTILIIFSIWNCFISKEIHIEPGLGLCIILLVISVIVILWATYKKYTNAKTMAISFMPWFILITYQYIDRIKDIGSIHYTTTLYLLIIAVIFHSSILWFLVLGRDARLKQDKSRLEWEMSNLKKQMSDQALFINMLNHEIRRPVQIIEANALDLSIDGALAFQDRKESFTRLRQATRELANLLDTCLSKLRLVCTNYIDAKEIPIKTFISMIVEQCASQSREHLITFRNTQLPEIFNADPTLLSILIYNLLENAIKHTPGDGIILITAQIGTSGELVIEVIDDGPGIPLKEIDKVFDRYYQISPSQQGMGLGLYICKRIVELHGGTIVCSSTMGEGAIFRATILPQVPEKKGSISA